MNAIDDIADTVLLMLDIADFSHLASIFILLQKMKSSSVRLSLLSISAATDKGYRAALGYLLNPRRYISSFSYHDISVRLQPSWTLNSLSSNLYVLSSLRPILDLYRFCIQYYI